MKVQFTADTCERIGSKPTYVPMIQRNMSKGEVVELEDEIATRLIKSGLMEKAKESAGWDKPKPEKEKT